MLVVGEDPKKYINEYSNEFMKDFIHLLKTGHGEKSVHINKFYQEYIANKEHIHMNATKWPSLTEFAKHLAREGICRVDENDKGIHIAWIDDSPEALRRKEALKRKEAQDQGDEELEQRMLREQIKRAQAAASAAGNGGRDKEVQGEDEPIRELKRQGDEKITISFGARKPDKTDTTEAPKTEDSQGGDTTAKPEGPETTDSKAAETEKAPVKLGFGGMSMKMGAKPQTKNVFAKNALGGSSKKSGGKIEQPKKISEAERIMKAEMERKRSRESAGFGMPGPKKHKS